MAYNITQKMSTFSVHYKCKIKINTSWVNSTTIGRRLEDTNLDTASAVIAPSKLLRPSSNCRRKHFFLNITFETSPHTQFKHYFHSYMEKPYFILITFKLIKFTFLKRTMPSDSTSYSLKRSASEVTPNGMSSIPEAASSNALASADLSSC